MSQRFIYFLIMLIFSMEAFAQQVKIVNCPCNFKIDPQVLKIIPDNAKQYYTSGPNLPDSSFQKQCGYLLVPENRKKKNSRLIKLPFIVVKSKIRTKVMTPYFIPPVGREGVRLAQRRG